MDIDILKGHFERMGARLDVTVHDGPRLPQWGRFEVFDQGETQYVLNVHENGRSSQERFTLDIWPTEKDYIEFVTADLHTDWRHLLLMVKRFDRNHTLRERDRFLCGHDERHWFIASISDENGIANVSDAMESLKPQNVIRSQHHHRVRPKNWHKRRNAGFVRQGEWFFIPETRFRLPDKAYILRNEPLRRRFGRAHIVEEIFRSGGQTVYVCRHRPAGLLKAEFEALVHRNPKAKNWNWRVMRLNPDVYARGKVRHPDHKTIVLPYWHRVAMATERGTAAGGRPATVGFLD